MNSYRFETYSPSGRTSVTREANRADDLLPNQNFASKTRRWQRSPVGADRDNVHVQFDGGGHHGIAIRRLETEPGEAEHRNDVAVARDWVARGNALAKLQEYGAYKSVTAADVQNVTDADIFPARDAVSAVGYAVK